MEHGDFELGTDGPSMILAAVDDSVTGLRAGAYAAGLARRQEARFIAVYVVPVTSPVLTSGAGASVLAAERGAHEQIAEELAGWADARARVLGISVTFITAHGDPYREITRIAGETRADALVVGASLQAGHRLKGDLPLRECPQPRGSGHVRALGMHAEGAVQLAPEQDRVPVVAQFLLARGAPAAPPAEGNEGGEHMVADRQPAARGLATLNVDRLGQGASSAPPAAELTHARHVHAVRQVLAAVRAGALGAVPPSLVLAGHSMGSAVALAAADDAVAGVLVTGFAHRSGEASGARTMDLIWPAAGDPGLPPGRYGEGYLTSRPGARAELFYTMDSTDPEMVAEDERHKGTLAAVELAGFHEFRLRVLDLKAPLMYVVGSADPLFGPFAGSGDLIAVEQSFAPGSESVDGLLLDGMHHNVNLHRGASAWFGQALNRVAAPTAG